MKKLLILLIFLLPGCALKHQQLGPEVRAPELTKTYYKSSDGVTLPVTTWGPKNNPVAIVLALHGFNDYRMAFEEPAAYFASQGILTIAYDQRGFGETENAGLWAKRDVLAHDILDMVTLIRKKYPGKPVFLMGESMGGALALYSTKAQESLTGLILVAPAVWGWRPVNIFGRPGIWVGAHIMPGQKFSGKNFERVPSDNNEALIKLSEDPYVIKKSRLDAIYGLSRLMKHGLEAAPDIKVRTLLLYGEKDDLVPKKSLEELWETLPGDLKTRRTYENGYHLLLRDCDAGEVWQTIVAFIGAQAGVRIDQPNEVPSLCEESE